MKSFEEYLAESNACEVKFGKVLFGSFGTPYEKNTAKEKQVMGNVLDYLQGDARPSVNHLNAFKDLDKCRTYFKKKLVPPVRYVYRGASLPVNQLKKLNFNREARSYLVASNYIYKPRGMLQGFSINFREAVAFSNESVVLVNSDEISVIYEFKVDKTFIMNPAYMDKLGKYFLGFGTEHEVIHMSNKPMKVRIFVHKGHADEII